MLFKDLEFEAISESAEFNREEEDDLNFLNYN